MKSLYIALEHILFMLSTNTKWQNTFKWAANGCMAISALIVSFSMGMAELPLAFIGFLFGHILWALSAVAMRDKALIALNVGFIPVDLYAMYIRL